MEDGQSSASEFECHSCACCQQILLDFNMHNAPKALDSTNSQCIFVPMPFEGFATTDEDDTGLVQRINEFLALTANSGCSLTDIVMKEFGTPTGSPRVKALFSWIGGIELFGINSSICLLNYYWAKSADSSNFYLDPNTYRIPSNKLHQIKKKLSHCQESHPECQSRYQSPFVPKRLLQIDRVNDGWCIRLKYPSSPQNYTALSYCWGGAQETMLTTLNQLVWETRGPHWREFPRTIQDAMLITFTLGFKFLWVDSLCILQDSDEDKATQISDMPRIYDCAVMTLSAVGMASVHDGLFKPMRRPLVHAKDILKLKVHGAPDSCDNAILVPSNQVNITSLEEDGGRGPLDQRAWTFQETLLSRRRLKFTSSSMRWECQRQPEREFDEGMKALLLERFPLHPALCRIRHHANLKYILQKRRLHCPTGRKSETPETGFDQPDIYPWNILVEEYTKRSLTFAQDRPLAISGIAQRIGSELEDQYCAGLWRSCLVDQLGWYDDVAKSTNPFDIGMPGLLCVARISAESHPGMIVHQWGGAFSLPMNDDYKPSHSGIPIGRQAEDRSKELKAPSWSWLSIPNPVRFRVLNVWFTLDILDVEVEPLLAAAPFGDVRLGRLTVRGLVKPAALSDGAYIGRPPNHPLNSAGNTFLWLKLGEDRSAGVGTHDEAICLELQKNSGTTWVRTGLVMTDDKDWLDTKTVIII